MLIDAHTHLDEYIKYENGQELQRQALNQIKDNKIISLANSMDIPSYMKTLCLSEKSNLIIPCFGIHPWRAAAYAESPEHLEQYITSCSIIGEIGLDFVWAEKNTFQSQVKVFEYFLAHNKKINKIMNIHTKGAEREIIELLDKYHSERVIIHWYSGPEQELRELIKRGCYFTVSVQVSYSEAIRAIAREIPLDRLLLETDNPGGEEWLSKTIGMPAHIKKVYKKTAEIKNISVEELEQKVWHNYITI